MKKTETGSFFLRLIPTIKFLTLLTLTSIIVKADASVVTQTKAENYLRWSIFAEKEQLVIKKEKSRILISTLNRDVFDKLKDSFRGIKADKTYISSVQVKEISDVNNVAILVVNLADPDVELFHFFRAKDNKLIMDFWRNDGFVAAKKGKTPIKEKKIKVDKPKVSKVIKKVLPRVAPKKEVAKTPRRRKESNYKDYRYGASFWWNYDPISPKIKKVVNLERKTPEFFFPIRDREYGKDDKEAHLQTTINMYRKKKWGRMYQSMRLYAQTYGEDTDLDFNEYIKANALLRINFQKKDSGTVKQAINILENIGSRTKNYRLKKGIHKYLISYFLMHHENVKAYQLAKTYYVETKDQFDIEESGYAAEVILFCLAQMNQLDVITKLLSEQTIKKLLPSQLMFAYKIYTLVKLGDIKAAVKFYEKIKNQLKAGIHHTIVFNIGECYFRMAKFEKSIEMFDKFVVDSSYVTSSERARLRIALAYEILEKDHLKTTELYKNAINRSQSEEVQYEARVRYVGLRSVRKKILDDSDREIRVFLERKYGKVEEFSKNLKKILWLVRLRTFIVDGKYNEALAYLNAIPLKTLRPEQRRVFEGDGAEIVSGILRNYYKDGEYSKVVQAWEIYKDRYINKVASDPMLNYIVGRSFVKLGLFDGFDKQLTSFEKVRGTPTRTFPSWIDRDITETPDELVADLKIARNIKLGNWNSAERVLDSLERKNPESNKVNYYRGILANNKKDYQKVIKSFEKYLANTTGKEMYDNYDVAIMMQMYTNALYDLGKVQRFKDVAKAMLQDTKHVKNNKYMNKVKERVSYLLIELVSAENKPESHLEVEPMILEFKKNHKDSIYQARINYLLGMSYLSSERQEEGKKMFEEVLKAENASEYIKELVRSELALIKIKNKTI